VSDKQSNQGTCMVESSRCIYEDNEVHALNYDELAHGVGCKLAWLIQLISHPFLSHALVCLI
jgi:hypothetical protein